MDYASKNCVLLFDEMDVQNVYSHNSRLQETISPAKKLLVVMVREVFENPPKSYLALNKDCEICKPSQKPLFSDAHFILNKYECIHISQGSSFENCLGLLTAKNLPIFLMASSRGLIKGFKQIVYYSFDEVMNEELLMDIIKKVEGTGLCVRAVGCDMGNQRVSVRLDLTVCFTVVRSKLDCWCVPPPATQILKLS